MKFFNLKITQEENTRFSHVMDIISKNWKSLSDINKRKLSMLLLDRPDYLIGNEKWILYNYICQVPSPAIVFTGNYSYYKIKNMLSDISDIVNKDEYQSCKGIINGENIYLVNNNESKYKLQRNEVKIVNSMKKGNVITLYFK